MQFRSQTLDSNRPLIKCRNGLSRCRNRYL